SFFGSSSFFSFLFKTLGGFFAGLRFIGVVTLFALHQTGGIQKTGYAVGWLRANAQPMFCAINVKHNTLFVIFREQWVVAADTLDKLTIAGRANVGDHDFIIRTFLGATTGQIGRASCRERG